MKIVYFDGYCNVCNRFVDFLIRHDRKRELKYAPLQGTTARARLKKELTEQVETMAFEESMSFTESQIALFTLTDDAREGQKAFQEKRKPVWVGQ